MKSATQGDIKVEIDRELCIGAASCAIIAPNTFLVDDQGKVDLLAGDWDDLATIEAAADSCPVRAIIVTKLQGSAGGEHQAKASSDEPEKSQVVSDISQAAGQIDHQLILDQLRTVLDPELGINMVDLGLVYGIKQEGSTISVEMTLTTPGCPLIKEFVQSVYQALIGLDGIEDVDVNLTFDPPWDPSKMSPEAAEELGFFI